MAEREKVIKGLECCVKTIEDCECADNCPYESQCWDGTMYLDLMRDALELLKAPEPVEPDVDVDTWICGKCGHKLEYQEMVGSNILFHEQYSYCPNCGRKVKWDD